MDTVSVRYPVHHVDTAIASYTQQLDFVTESPDGRRPAPSGNPIDLSEPRAS